MTRKYAENNINKNIISLSRTILSLNEIRDYFTGINEANIVESIDDYINNINELKENLSSLKDTIKNYDEDLKITIDYYKRNKEIYNLFKKGKSEKQIADIYGLSIRRVIDICYKEKNNEKLAKSDKLFNFLLHALEDNPADITTTYNILRRNNIKSPEDIYITHKKNKIYSIGRIGELRSKMLIDALNDIKVYYMFDDFEFHASMIEMFKFYKIDKYNDIVISYWYEDEHDKLFNKEQ